MVNRSVERMSNVSANSLDPFAGAEKLSIQVKNGFEYTILE